MSNLPGTIVGTTYSSDCKTERNTVPSCRILVIVEDVYYLLIIRNPKLFGRYFLIDESSRISDNNDEGLVRLTSPNSSAGSLRLAIISDDVHSRC